MKINSIKTILRLLACARSILSGLLLLTLSPICSGVELDNWTRRSSPSASSLGGIAFGEGMYVTVGSTPTFPAVPLIMSSPDGIGWTVRMNTATNSRGFSDVAFGNGVFAAVGFTYDPGIYRITVFSSRDGINWTPRLSSTSGNLLTSVVWGGNGFAGVGWDGTLVTSADGTNWSVGSFGSALTFWDVTYGAGLYVAVGDDGDIRTSTNGINWISRTSGTDTSLTGVAFGDGTFVAVGSNGIILTSTNALNWTPRTSGTTELLLDVNYAAGRFVAVGPNNFTNRNTILISSNGINWAPASAQLRPQAEYLRKVGYGNGLFIIVGDSAGDSLILTANAGPIGPTIVTPPASQQVFSGSNAVFDVSATTTNPPLRYQWRFNQADLPGETNDTLTISNAQVANVGAYQVVLSDTVGSVGSAIVRLDLVDALFITTQPTNVAVRAGSNATFSVVVYGTQPLHYQWQHDGVDVADATNSVLTITNVQPMWLGDYTAIITNEYGAVTSAVATLTFLTQPRITGQPQPVTVVAGENAVFTITVTNTATLPVTYQWRKVSTVLTNITLYSTNCSFTLFNVRTNVTLTDGPGNYRVVVMNAAFPQGLVSSFAELKVLQFAPELHLTVTRNGDMLQLTATGTTNTQWRLEWRDSVTDTNAWQPLTNITLGPSPTVIQQPLDSTNRFYRGAWLP